MQSFSTSATLSPPRSALQFVGPAVLRQLTCNLSALIFPVTQPICIGNVSKLHLSFITLSLGSCAVKASFKHSITAALMMAGSSSSRAGPGQLQLPISMARPTLQSSGSPTEVCRGHHMLFGLRPLRLLSKWTISSCCQQQPFLIFAFNLSVWTSHRGQTKRLSVILLKVKLQCTSSVGELVFSV